MIFFCNLLRKSLLLLGAIRLIHIVVYLIHVVRRFCIRPNQDLLQRYGKGSWALITGASDGIGAEYARQLAAQGFNIFLVSRTLSKLNSVADELKKLNNEI
jgi:17beta-estradiol 17-dehydrogenase / very-long-chain 3-oxoacyl-CoA reductase